MLSLGSLNRLSLPPLALLRQETFVSQEKITEKLAGERGVRNEGLKGERRVIGGRMKDVDVSVYTRDCASFFLPRSLPFVY